MLQPDTLVWFFTLKHELPSVEFKGPGKGRDNPLFGKVVRAAIAMANRHNGGSIIIGIAETGTSLSFDGLSADLLATWKYEDIASGFNTYASPQIEFKRYEYEHNGKVFLILEIDEFTTMPVMCIKEYRDKSNPKLPVSLCPIILRPGAFYIRTANKPESKEMLTGEEARTLFALVADKAIQGFVTHTKLAGIAIAPLPKDNELFERQLEDWTSPLLEAIRSRGFWDIRIRPMTFQQERLPLSQLRPLLIRASLDYRGWEFPYITPMMTETGFDWIGLENQKENGLQAWRFFQSGQFAAAVGILDDWDEKLSYPYPNLAKPGECLSMLDVVFRLTEIFGLASRLAITEVYRDERSIVIGLALRKVRHRRLKDRGVNGSIGLAGYTTAAEQIPYRVTLAKEDVIARPRELALEAAQFFFERFGGLQLSMQFLASLQAELRMHS